MKTAPILRQMPVAPSSRLVGQASPLPQRTSALAAGTRSHPEPAASAPVLPPAASNAMSELEIEQRSLAIAQRMIQAEAEKVRKAAHEEGFRSGMEEGLRAAQTQVAEQLRDQQTRFVAVGDALVQALQRERGATEDAALELTMAALARILGEAPDAERVANIIRKAGEQLRDPSHVRVRLAPADMELLRAASVDVALLVPQAADVQWVSDPTIEGGCVLQTASGSLDARLQKQVVVLAEALSRTYRSRGVHA